MKTEHMTQKRRSSRCGYYGSDLADKSQARAIESRSGRRSVRQELQPHRLELRGTGYVTDDGEE